MGDASYNTGLPLVRRRENTGDVYLDANTVLELFRQMVTQYARPPSREFQKYNKHCGVIKTDGVFDILRRAQQSTGGLSDEDRRCFQYAITLIEKIIERAGAAVWKDARLTIRGAWIDVTLWSGSETNKFEIRLDGYDNPYDKQIESGLRLKFWNAIHTIKEKASNLWSFVGRVASAIHPAIGWH
ncbi:uncharacterized protein LOC102802650 [Saccoglossus kowalevskii]|uniref:Uncharacterized protein LOC102802650 n=1 Tax=Saccoglossus kowalevskii TaxID=10224 RepID=A0ABM0N047_SACKO|nr:PREDICTED: uncharacterized protein LOC102802650 [Saccoglossus kowalevskii]